MSDPISASLHQPTAKHFVFGVFDRKLTGVVFMPSNKNHYIYVKRSTFKSLICHWISFVDSFIAKTSDHDREFYALGENGEKLKQYLNLPSSTALQSPSDLTPQSPPCVRPKNNRIPSFDRETLAKCIRHTAD